ncbi:MAG: hypothetical protein JWO53_374 [Chlamydiia bacterium]|nr:hypothetical protein [Chlamydiia bacterium]
MIDLTHSLNEAAPSWSGSCGFHAHICMDYAEGCRVMQYEMSAGIGTHMDAPLHFIKEGMDIASIPLKSLIAPLCVLHIDIEGNPDYLVSVEDLKAYEAKFGLIPEGALVAANFGWATYWDKPESYRNEDSHGMMHFPGFSPQTAAYLLERKIVGIGVDTLSPDGGNTAFPVHHLILGSGGYILENLASLDKVPPCGALAIALPPKIDGGAEAICRVIAIVAQSV